MVLRSNIVNALVTSPPRSCFEEGGGDFGSEDLFQKLEDINESDTLDDESLADCLGEMNCGREEMIHSLKVS